MIINLEGKQINITEKNVRAYKKMNSIIPDQLMVTAYLETRLDNTIERITQEYSDIELSNVINNMIEAEVRACAGNEVYENA